MTREQAIRLVRPHAIEDPHAFVNALESLGLLKLHEPSAFRVEDALIDVLHKAGYYVGRAAVGGGDQTRSHRPLQPGPAQHPR